MMAHPRFDDGYTVFWAMLPGHTVPTIFTNLEEAMEVTVLETWWQLPPKDEP